MVRETRHLWVGNLPDNIREDRIREHFKRYGRVQNVKVLGRTDNANSNLGGNGNSGVCATVAFMDIKSASKAHNAEHVLDERTLTTEYYEPAAIPLAAGAPSAGSSPAGSGYSGSSSSVNSAPTQASVSRYHISGGEDNASNTCPLAASAAAPANWRGTNDSATTEYCRRGNTPSFSSSRYQRNNSTAPYATPPSNVERTTTHQRWYASGERATGTTGGESTPSTPGGCTESGRRRRHSGSGSSRSDSSSPEPSDTSRASTPATQPPLHHANHRTPPTLQHQWASTASGRPLAICVRNLPTRSTDSSLKDGLYHEYKKHGKVVWVKVVGQNADRYAVVRFKKPSDVEKALEVSQDKLFFGCKISVAPHQSCEEDADSAKPYETDIDEYHPKATRTLFIGNLEKDVTQQQLRDKFKHFGRIIEIDIKKGSGGGAGYAFCQYASISSVVEAIRAMDGEYVGGSRVKLGFGKPVATTCVWVDGLTEHTEKQVLGAVSRCGAATSVCVDRAAGAALVHFEQAAAAGAAVRELRRVAAAASAAEPDHPRLCVDYASRECQEAFYEQLEKHGGSAALTGPDRLTSDITTRYLPQRHETLRYDGCGSRSRASSYGRGSSRTPRYSSLEHYDPTEYAADRRYRVYDEPGSSPQNEEASYEDRLQSVVVSPHRARRHRRDSSPEDRKHSKERHRSGVRRSRSGSRGGDRHSARRRHRRRHDGSGSRAGTPLRDEPDALPVEPRRPPRERPPLPMSLPLPKFAAQLLRTAPPTPRLHHPPALAPDSPPRPPSASSSSGGSAPHSPSLEERIRSLDEKYEKWSGTRALAELPDRTRLRHRLLDIDINEVKPSEVVRSLLAKRSVFDEDSERLEGAVRQPSPTGGLRSRSVCTSRRFTFAPVSQFQMPLPTDGEAEGDIEGEVVDRPADPRLNRPERPPRIEMLGKFNESDYRMEERPGPHTPPSTSTMMDIPSVKISKDDGTMCDNQNKLSVFMEDNLHKCKFDTDYDGMVSNEKIIKEVITREMPFDTIKENSEHETINYLEERNNFMDSVETDTQYIMEMLLKKVENYQEQEIKESRIKESSKSSVINETFKGLKNPDADISDKSKEDASNAKYNIEINASRQNDKNVGETHIVHFNNISSAKIHNEISEACRDLIKSCEKNGKDKYGYNILEVFHTSSKLEKENIQFEKSIEKDKFVNNSKTHVSCEKTVDNDKCTEDRLKHERDKLRHSAKDHVENDWSINEKTKNIRHDRYSEKDKKREDSGKSLNHILDKIKIERGVDRLKIERDDKTKILEEKLSRDNHQKREKCEKDKRKDSFELDSSSRSKKDDKCKYDKSKKESEIKREIKKESDIHKTRKHSRDETSREMIRKDSTDSATSRTSHESSKTKEVDSIDVKEEFKTKSKHSDYLHKQVSDKDFFHKNVDIKVEPASECSVKLKTEIKEEKISENICKNKVETFLEQPYRTTKDVVDKQRHYSLDSPNLDSKRKERLNSCSSLPSTIGHKRRMSSQDSIDCLNEDKKSRTELKYPERTESKDCRGAEKHKTTKFSKCHFAKLIESKTKDDKKNLVKPPDQITIDLKEADTKKDYKPSDHVKSLKKSPKDETEKQNIDLQPDGLRNDLDFLATLELRSSEEDERQKALRKEMKEKKRIQQLQQIQELQMQQDALQQAELMCKLKDDKKPKTDERKKEIARDKRMSTDRKSREEKHDSNKRKPRKHIHTSDSSDSDEPKKHSIFDIVDDEPTYISMYDKVKARSCKNMQKQEEEKRQEKIKAKFSQLKQSRAKREEKKRSSWDEDSDSDQDRKRLQKSSLDNSSDDENIAQCKKQDQSNTPSPDYDVNKRDEYYPMICNDEGLQHKVHSRKNSRSSRIISDTSDEEVTKGRMNKSPNNYFNDKKTAINNSEFSEEIKAENVHFKETEYHKMKRKSLFNLFGKSDSDDTKVKSFDSENDCKSSFVKLISNDFSSESESMLPARNIGDVRKKHKKKVKKHKSVYSDDELKKDIENSDTSAFEMDKHKLIDKQRRHTSKKEKRKDKIRASFDTDELHEEKNKKKDKSMSIFNNFDFQSDAVSNSAKKEGKMEDIFGPLSDDSDKDCRNHQNKIEFSVRECEVNYSALKNDFFKNTSHEIKLSDKEETRRKKEKKRKEKRMSKDDDNSLDVDAVSKAIEARLFADADDDSNVKTISMNECFSKVESAHLKHNHDKLINLENNKHEIFKKECKEKKKKKKRNKEDRQFRKDHHFYHQENSEKQDMSNITENLGVESSLKMALIDIPLPKENDEVSTINKSEDSITHVESPSLPRLTDSPPVVKKLDEIVKSEESSQTLTANIEEVKTNNLHKEIFLDISVDSDYQITTKVITEESHDQSKSESDNQNLNVLMSPYETAINEPIVANTPEYENDENKMTENKSEKIDIQSCKIEKKVEEKPRAVISQEETEDAVAALLGESFGGKEDNFSGYDEVEINSTCQNEVEHAEVENENIPEEDAEEMRQAVQNLNASEMEIKPDTPVSDNDLLLIDTDTEEQDETGQDAIERLPVNIIATSQSLTNNADKNKLSHISNLISKLKQNVTQPVETGINDCNTTVRRDAEMKIQLTKRDNVQIITSTATPVITSWPLTNNKSLDSHAININTLSTSNAITKREIVEAKANHITANIVQIRTPSIQNIQTNNMPRAVAVPARTSAPFQVIGQPLRARATIPQSQQQSTPPTIKIPESHILYQRPQGIVISPRVPNEPTLLSPKASPRGENSASPRLGNMTILSGSPQGMSGPSPRTSAQVTVVRVPQLPSLGVGSLSGAGAVRALLSPPRPGSVLVPAPTPPTHFNRLPVAPVLAPISKQVAVANVTNVVSSNKTTCPSSPKMHHQKITVGDCGKLESRPDTVTENSKILLSPTNLQRNSNPAVVTQNRLIMQNTVHVGNVSSALHLNNKVLINTVNHLNDKRADNQIQKPEQTNHIPFAPAPIIHVAGVNHSSAPLIHQGTPKSVVCNVQDTMNRCKGGPNVIHTFNSQRRVPSSSIGNLLQLESNKGSTSVLSIRNPTVLTKLDGSPGAVTTTSFSTISPLLIKTTSAVGSLRFNTRVENEDIDMSKCGIHVKPEQDKEMKCNENIESVPNSNSVKNNQTNNLVDSASSKVEQMAKCETDFEELLKDNTNEIKVTNDPEKKLEVNVGKTVTLISSKAQCRDKLNNINIKENLSQISSDVKYLEHSYSQPHSINSTDNRIEETNNLQKPMEIPTEVTVPPSIDKHITIESNVNKHNNDNNTHCNEKNIVENKLIVSENENSFKLMNVTKNDNDSTESHLKTIHESDSWSAKDVNIESVIKKVDSLCNETTDTDNQTNTCETTKIGASPKNGSLNESNSRTTDNTTVIGLDCNISPNTSIVQEAVVEINQPSTKRGGRSIRGKKNEKHQDRVQTRQISKPARGGTSAKRGRGRTKVDKKFKSLVNNNTSTIPGDVYDFHDDSGDETTASPTKSETRPRLILTIKSPLSGTTSNVTATSSLMISQKDQNKNTDRGNKEEKSEDFSTPSLNTRKSRRLQEKDVHRSTVDDVIEDVVKGAVVQTKSGKETPRKRTTRQTGAKIGNNFERLQTSETRKSPRGVKRPRDTSLSDASVESGDEKVGKHEENSRDAKIARPMDATPPATITTVVPIVQPVASATVHSIPTPIIKPPKKMISEISAKLGCAFEPGTGERASQAQLDRPLTEMQAEKLTVTNLAGPSESGETGSTRRPPDGVPGPPLLVGAAEPGDARVQSPALPHRPPSLPPTHRPADRATPILGRDGAGDADLIAGGAGVAGSVGGGAGVRGWRGPYAATASLPRGAHHPPQPPYPHHSPHPQLPHHPPHPLEPHAHPIKHVAIVPPHHSAPAPRLNVASVPSMSPQGQQIPPSEGGYSHFSHQHYQMYQQHFRATQHESRTTPSPYTRSLEAEGCEAPTPPLELRRPPSARVPRPAHSPAHSPSPGDRHIMYAVRCGRSPPPAHGTSRLPGALPPSAAPGPPHASQVPREADSLQMLLRRYPVMWQGLLALKNDSAAVQMHFVGGNPGVAGDTLSRHSDGSTPLLRIAQRMRLEQAQLDQVHRKMKVEHEHCTLLALPCGRDHMDVLQQSTNLSAGFITYLQRKQAAGIVNIAPPGHHQAMFTVHIFPSCDFANENLNRIAPDLMHRVADIAHLLIVIATV